jgi:hypothetical protein
VAITVAAARKLAASMTATSHPPVQANRAAPTSGPKSRKASLVVCREELASTSRSSGISSLSRPFSAAGRTTKDTPYRKATSQISQTSPASRTSTSGSTTNADATLPHTSSGLRRMRSIHTPRSGANSAGMTMKKNVRPAWALEPVSVFTHMLRTSSMIESPNIDAVSPAYSRVNPGRAKAALILLLLQASGRPRRSARGRPRRRTRTTGSRAGERTGRSTGRDVASGSRRRPRGSPGTRPG